MYCVSFRNAASRWVSSVSAPLELGFELGHTGRGLAALRELTLERSDRSRAADNSDSSAETRARGSPVARGAGLGRGGRRLRRGRGRRRGCACCALELDECSEGVVGRLCAVGLGVPRRGLDRDLRPGRVEDDDAEEKRLDAAEARPARRPRLRSAITASTPSSDTESTGPATTLRSPISRPAI